MFRLIAGLAAAATVLSAAPAGAAGTGDDVTPPQITINGPSGLKDGWGPEPYNVTVSVTDSGGSGMSGVDWELTGATTASGSRQGGGAFAVPVTGSGMSTLSVHATDKAGNKTSTSADFGVDTTPPWITLGSELGVADKNTVVMGSEVHADYTCGDSDSGIGLCTSDVPQGGLLDTSEVGPHSLVLMAQDKVLRNNFYTLTWEVVKGTFSLISPITYNRVPNVGDSITALPPKFTPTPDSISYQWLRNGEPIAGATDRTYVTTVADGNAQLAIQATPHRYGYNEDPFTAGAVRVDTTSVGFNGSVDLVGTAQVGKPLTVQIIGDFQPAHPTITYRWYRGSSEKPIPGATEASYTPTAADIGTSIVAHVLATAPGFDPYSADLNSELVRPDEFEVTGSVVTAGNARVGSVLTVTAPTFAPTPEATSYEWLRNGKPIGGAGSSSYRLTAADAGSRITARVTARRLGYRDNTLTSAPSTVVTRTTPALSVTAKALKKHRVSFVVTVRAAGVVPTGSVRLLRNGRVIGSAHKLANGSVRFAVAAQPKGRKTFVIAYDGDRGVNAGSVKVRVRIR